MLSGQFISQNVALNFSPDGFDSIYTHRIYFESIMLNLISNAIKYRKPDEDPLIVVSTRLENNKKIIEVKDNGLGINLARYGDKIFGFSKTFHRHPEAKGVGLYITKSQVESLGGNITVESEVNKGSKFIITFD